MGNNSKWCKQGFIKSIRVWQVSAHSYRSVLIVSTLASPCQQFIQLWLIIDSECCHNQNLTLAIIKRKRRIGRKRINQQRVVSMVLMKLRLAPPFLMKKTKLLFKMVLLLSQSMICLMLKNKNWEIRKYKDHCNNNGCPRIQHSIYSLMILDYSQSVRNKSKLWIQNLLVWWNQYTKI